LGVGHVADTHEEKERNRATRRRWISEAFGLPAVTEGEDECANKLRLQSVKRV